MNIDGIELYYKTEQANYQMLMKYIQTILLCCVFVILPVLTIKPTKQIDLYPNTQDSPSLYLIGFQLSNELAPGSYILFNFGQLSDIADPYHCILVNTSIQIRCTNYDVPDFTITFDKSVMGNYNPQFIDAYNKSIIIQLSDTLQPDTEYFLQVSLRNTVQNMKRFSQSCEIYCLSSDGLVYEENINFGHIQFQPPVVPLLKVSILNDLSQNTPGQLSTLKAQIQITLPIKTPYSALFFVLQDPFKFSESSYVRIDESEDYATSPIPLNSAPQVAFFQVRTPNIFYLAFKEQFATQRKFILEITEIRNPFFIADSNISIYSADFNSLTPLQQFENKYPLATVTQDLTLTLGLPYDMPIQGPCVFYRSIDQYFKITFNMPMNVPEGYSIKLYMDRSTIRAGTAYINFESLQYTTVYAYTSNTIIMKGMGPIMQGSLLYITYRAYKDSITNFYVAITIDTEEVIEAGASSYMFYGRADASSQDRNTIISEFQDTKIYEHFRVTAYIVDPSNLTYFDNFYLRVSIINSGEPTSAGSYVDMYLPPSVQFDPSYNQSTDCLFTSDTWGSCIATVNKTSQFVHITVVGSTSFLESVPNPFDGTRIFYIRKIRFPTISTDKNVFQTYLRLFNSSGVNPTTYIQPNIISILPPRNNPTGLTMEHLGDKYNLDYRYPGAMRFTCTTPSSMNYRVEENQKRVVSVLTRYGYKGFSETENQKKYPCASNIDVECYYSQGYSDYYVQSEWDKVHVFFPSVEENTTNFHVIIPHSNTVYSGDHRTVYHIGVYNQLTKDFKYYYRCTQFDQYVVSTTPTNLYTSMLVDFQGKAGSYRNNVTTTVSTGGISNGLNYLIITSQWYLFQNDKTIYSSTYSNPTMSYNERSPLSAYIGSNMYFTIIPFYCSGCSSTFTFNLDSLHMPYHYDLPNYYIYLYNPNGDMTAYNVFEMTNGGIFYEAYLKSLTLSCLDNYLGIKNTICEVKFSTNSPLKADGNMTIVFSGMNIATDNCQVYLPNGTLLKSTCRSTQDNKNVTIELEDVYDAYHYPSGNFTIKVHGVSIEADVISQSMTLYLHDITGKYVIEKGTRIFTTTVARPQNIQISQIVYNYLSPLSSNKMSLSFTIPRGLYDDERFGFIMGQDLSDVNLEIKRLKIVLTRLADGLVLQNTNQLISAQYKILFTFKDRSLLVPGAYSLEIYGIMTPASHENGAFSIIYQRKYDKGFTLTNSIETVFPEFSDRIISNISLNSFYNTEGHEQKLVFTIVNREKAVDDSMVWILNFPSYYSEELFNFRPYCTIDSAPIQCYADPATPYQMIIKSSPKIIDPTTPYTLSIFRIACPRSLYTHHVFKSRFLFVGILESIDSQQYIETSLLYPEQQISQNIPGTLIIEDVTITTLTNPTFSSIYTIFEFWCNMDITASSYFFLIFPDQFDNFNNRPLSIILKKINPTVILYSGEAVVTDRTISFQVSQLIEQNIKFAIQFPSLPTPKVQCAVQMSQTVGYITTNDRKQIYASSAISSNSAPILEFMKDPRYISFNSDNTVVITAGTYSGMIDITSSDGEQFLTNIRVDLSSPGFLFEPASVFLKLGDSSEQFRIGADAGLLPISYFYQTTKTQEVFTYYTITKNNNIKVTNTPVPIPIPPQIDISIGGCSKPFFIQLTNPPLNDLTVTYNYDNYVYDETLFWPNEHITNSELEFLPNVSEKAVSFCVSSSAAQLISKGQISDRFPLKFILAGTNHASYKFTDSDTITINLLSTTIIPTPTLTIETTNQQKSFLSFNLTTNIYSILYYHFKIGTEEKPLTSNEIKIKTKNNENVLESMPDYMDRMYTVDRDERVGIYVMEAGQHTVTFRDLLPERYYTLCVYMQTEYNLITSAKCISAKTQEWGTILKASLKFTGALSDENLNKILCFFSKEIDTQVKFVVDLEGNSCHDRKVQNLYYSYPGKSFTFQNQQTYLYVLPNPSFSSDPSVLAFENMYNETGQLTDQSLSSAIAGFAISYLTSKLTASFNGVTMLEVANPDGIKVSFDKPTYHSAQNMIKVNNIQLTDQGTVYFILLLYKQIKLDGNNSYVNIRMSTEPTKQQIINCQNWEGLPTDGCARAVYSSTPLEVTFTEIKDSCMYVLYYIVASEYPLRPILASQIKNDTVVTIQLFQPNNFIQLLTFFSTILLITFLN